MTQQKASVLNKADYDEIDRRISETIDEKIAHLPTKDEFYEKMDALMKEIKGVREDLAAHSMQHERIDEDIKGLKKNVNNLYEKLDLDQPVPQPAY